jgi:hypothetical protein
VRARRPQTTIVLDLDSSVRVVRTPRQSALDAGGDARGAAGD